MVEEGRGGAQRGFGICFEAQAHSYVIVSVEETWSDIWVSPALCHVNKLDTLAC